MASNKPRILHAPINIANQAFIISRAQRKLGMVSDVLVYRKDYLDYVCDIDLNLSKNGLINIVRSVFVLGTNLIKCLARYDVFHFHFGQSLLPYNLDLPLLKLFGKKIIMHYWGSDVIQLDLATKYTNFSPAQLRKIYPGRNDDRTRQRIKWLNSQVNLSIVGGYSLCPYSPESEVVPISIDLAKLSSSIPTKEAHPVRIVHAPTNREIKGTKYVLLAIQKLKKKYEIDFTMVENMQHDKALAIYQNADIVVDDVLQGPYGVLSIECMALKKPVIDYFNQNLKPYYPRLPTVNANPSTLYKNLEKLILNPGLRSRIGSAGKRYVEHHHSSDLNAKKLLRLYLKYGVCSKN